MKRLLVSVCLTLILLLSVHSPVMAAPERSNKYAVIVSNDNKPCAPVTATACARVLQGILIDAGFNRKNIMFISNHKATPEAVEDACLWLQQVGDADSEVVFAFFGHGYHAAVMGHKEYILHESLRDWLAPIESQKQLVIIDTCESGGAIIEGLDGITLCAPNRIVLTSVRGEIGSSVYSGRYTSWVIGVLIFGIKEGMSDLDDDGRVSIQEAAGNLGFGDMCDNYGQEYFLGR